MAAAAPDVAATSRDWPRGGTNPVTPRTDSTRARSAVTTREHLGTLSAADAAARTRALSKAGARILRGTFVDSAGVLRAKQVPIERASVFHSPGLGASPVWVIFCADDGIAFTPNFGVVGDMRLRADLGAAVSIADGSAWAPTELTDQDGRALAFCPRGTLRRQQAAAEAEGLEILAATEIEFVARRSRLWPRPAARACRLRG